MGINKLYNQKQKGGGLTGLIFIIILLAIGFVTCKSKTKTHKEETNTKEWRLEMYENEKVDVYASDEKFHKEWGVIAGKMRYAPTILTPRQEQPQITEEININGPIYNDLEQLGTLSMTIDPNGTITGRFEGKISKNKDKNYRGKLTGYIYPEAEHKEGPGKLFLACKFDKFLSNDPARLSASLSLVCIRGWLDSDYTAAGKIIFYECYSEILKGVPLDCTLIDSLNWEAKAN